MRRSRLAVILMVLLALVCFTSLPVVAELPWDADNNDGNSGDDNHDKPGDTIIIQPQEHFRTSGTVNSGNQIILSLLSSRYSSSQVFLFFLSSGVPANNGSTGGSNVNSQINGQ